MERTPEQTAAVGRLKQWALDPAQGGKILQLSAPGAWDRCHAFYRGKVPGHMIDGWCAELIHDATGEWPGSHGNNGHHG